MTGTATVDAEQVFVASAEVALPGDVQSPHTDDVREAGWKAMVLW